MQLTYDEVREICNTVECFKMKTQVIGNSTIAQCTYFLASAGDFFPDMIELEKDGETIIIYGETVINGKKAADMTDTELEALGFDFLSKFAFGLKIEEETEQ